MEKDKYVAEIQAQLDEAEGLVETKTEVLFLALCKALLSDLRAERLPAEFRDPVALANAATWLNRQETRIGAPCLDNPFMTIETDAGWLLRLVKHIQESNK